MEDVRKGEEGKRKRKMGENDKQKNLDRGGEMEVGGGERRLGESKRMREGILGGGRGEGGEGEEGRVKRMR